MVAKKAKKPVTKKATKKKSVAKPKAVKVAPRGQEFVFEDGVKISNLKQLADRVGDNSHYFSQHVNNEKNDFYAWILHVFKSEKLASQLKEEKSINVFRLKIYKYLLETK